MQIDPGRSDGGNPSPVFLPLANLGRGGATPEPLSAELLALLESGLGCEMGERRAMPAPGSLEGLPRLSPAQMHELIAQSDRERVPAASEEGAPGLLCWVARKLGIGRC